MNWTKIINDCDDTCDQDQIAKACRRDSPHLSSEELKIRVQRIKFQDRLREAMRNQKIMKLMMISYKAYCGKNPSDSMTFEEYSADMTKHAKEILSEDYL